MRAGRKGAGLLTVAIFTAVLVSLTAVSIVKVNQAAFSGYDNGRIILQAQQYAEAEAAVVKATAYDDLVAYGRAGIKNSDDYEAEVVISAEFDYTDSLKAKTATVNIYRRGESVPRFSLQAIKTSVETEQSGSGVPIGTIIAWPSTIAPAEGGIWLLCNGGSFSSGTYPQLYAVLGKSTLPNLDTRFLEGTVDTPGTTKNAGLPDIQGRASFQPHGSTLNGAFTSGSGGSGISGGGSKFYGGCTQFKASSSNSIYGASTTVQPASYLVRFYIKAS